MIVACVLNESGLINHEGTKNAKKNKGKNFVFSATAPCSRSCLRGDML